MLTLRKVLAILGGAAAGYAIASLWLLTLTDVGVGAAIAAMCWLLSGLISYVQKGRDMRLHPSCCWSGEAW